MADALTKIYVKVGSDFARWELKNIHAGKKGGPETDRDRFLGKVFELRARQRDEQSCLDYRNNKGNAVRFVSAPLLIR